MTLSSKRRAELRSEAHHLTPLVRVGQHGVTDTLVQTLDDALRTHELVKIQLGGGLDESAREAANALAQRTGSDVVQVIGHTATLYRENPALEKGKHDLPPWRR